MEHMDLIDDTNLKLLETIVQSVCPMLKEKINRFKALQGKLETQITHAICNDTFGMRTQIKTLKAAG